MPLVWNVGEVSKLQWSFGGSGQAAKERNIVGPYSIVLVAVVGKPM